MALLHDEPPQNAVHSVRISMDQLPCECRIMSSIAETRQRLPGGHLANRTLPIGEALRLFVPCEVVIRDATTVWTSAGDSAAVVTIVGAGTLDETWHSEEHCEAICVTDAAPREREFH